MRTGIATAWKEVIGPGPVHQLRWVLRVLNSSGCRHRLHSVKIREPRGNYPPLWDVLHVQELLCITFKALSGVAPCGAITFASKWTAGQSLTRSWQGSQEPLSYCSRGMRLRQTRTSSWRGYWRHGSFRRPSTRASSAGGTWEDPGHSQCLCLIKHAIRRIKVYCGWDSRVSLTLAGTANQIWSYCGTMVLPGSSGWWMLGRVSSLLFSILCSLPLKCVQVNGRKIMSWSFYILSVVSVGTSLQRSGNRLTK